MESAPRPTVTLKDRIQNWLTPKTATSVTSEPPPNVPARGSATVITVAQVNKPQEEPLAITNIPSSAQPNRTEVIVTKAPAKSSKPFPIASPTTPAPQDVVAVKQVEKADVLTTPERFPPKEEKLKPKGLLMAGNASPGIAPDLPPGAGSVLAARNGLDGPVAYVPIQPMVVPKPWRPPVPPDPKTPEAPQLNAFVNAFTPPPAPRSNAAPQGYGNPMMPYPPAMAYGYDPRM
jgi:hypothetical protein